VRRMVRVVQACDAIPEAGVPALQAGQVLAVVAELANGWFKTSNGACVQAAWVVDNEADDAEEEEEQNGAQEGEGGSHARRAQDGGRRSTPMPTVAAAAAEEKEEEAAKDAAQEAAAACDALVSRRRVSLAAPMPTAVAPGKRGSYSNTSASASTVSLSSSYSGRVGGGSCSSDSGSPAGMGSLASILGSAHSGKPQASTSSVAGIGCEHKLPSPTSATPLRHNHTASDIAVDALTSGGSTRAARVSTSDCLSVTDTCSSGRASPQAEVCPRKIGKV